MKFYIPKLNIISQAHISPSICDQNISVERLSKKCKEVQRKHTKEKAVKATKIWMQRIQTEKVSGVDEWINLLRVCEWWQRKQVEGFVK